MNNAYVIGLNQIGKNDIMIAGGKGANLGEIIRMNNINRLMGDYSRQPPINFLTAKC